MPQEMKLLLNALGHVQQALPNLLAATACHPPGCICVLCEMGQKLAEVEHGLLRATREKARASTTVGPSRES